MDVPPGIRYLNSLVPFFAIPPCIVLLAIRITNVYLGANISTTLTVLATLLARPALSVFQRYYTRYVDRRNAAANNAFILPHVEEKRPNFAGLSIMKLLLEDFKHGYPGNTTGSLAANREELMPLHFIRRCFSRVDQEVWFCIPAETPFR